MISYKKYTFNKQRHALKSDMVIYLKEKKKSSIETNYRDKLSIDLL
jgi:hypothetical protein